MKNANANATRAWSPVVTCVMTAMTAPVTEKHYGVGKRECFCGSEHTPEWWAGYDAGRHDGFEEAAEWGGTWCKACNEPH